MISLINIFTPKPGKLDELQALQAAESRRLGRDSARHGWLGNRIYRTTDDGRLIIVTHFASEEGKRSWQETDAFRDHLDRLDPVLERVESIPVEQVALNPSPAPLRLALVIGSTRKGRFADRPADWIEAKAAGDERFELCRFDLRDYRLPFFGDPEASAEAKAAADRFASDTAGFDAYLLTAAEYNHAPTAVLKNALDHADWARKPVGFVAYGGVGGARAVEHLRQIAIELHMLPTRSAVHIGFGDFRAISAGEKTIADHPHLEKTCAALLDELAEWGHVLRGMAQSA